MRYLILCIIAACSIAAGPLDQQLSQAQADLASKASQATVLVQQANAAMANAVALENQASAAQAGVSSAQVLVDTIQKQILASYVPNGSDLAPVLEKAVAGSTIQCFPNGSYTLGHTVQMKTTGVTLDLNGSSLSCIPSVGASSNIVVYGPHFTFANAHVTRANVLFRVYGPSFTLTDSTVDNCASVILTGEIGTGMVVQRCAFGANIATVPIYVTSDNSTIINCSFAGSLGEYRIRYDFDSNGRKPVGGLISNCSFPYNPNAFGKDTIGFRGNDSGRITNCIISGDVRCGGDPKPPSPPVSSATLYNAACIIDHCIFTNIADGGAAIRIYKGATVASGNNTFVCGPNTTPISVDAFSVVTATDNVQQHAPGVTVKALIGLSSLGSHTESGTTQTVVAVPTTQPTTHNPAKSLAFAALRLSSQR